METYEIINPSDCYTLKAENFKEAAVAILLLSPHFGLASVKEGGPHMPPFVFGGMDEWLKENVCPREDISKFFEDHKEAIIRVLESVLIGPPEERKTFEAAMEAIDDPTKREAFREKWHDGKRSSMNDIGGAAWDLAKRLRKGKG